jgi:NTP pyrophosphatase (non-canonical NTP hydrolase)
MNEFKELMTEIDRFTEERDWDQFHNPKDLALALSIEASELMELYLWKNPEEANIGKVREELADVFNYAFLIASKYQFDVPTIVREKLAKNAQKYPVEKAKGVATKYDEL